MNSPIKKAVRDARSPKDTRILHFSTVHLRDDSRIRSKMMASLHLSYPGQIRLLVQDGLGNETDKEGYPVIDTGPRLKRIQRMTLGGWRMFRAVLRERPKIAHFHDPELIPWAILLSLFGIKIVYDIHEDYPEAVSENYRLPSVARKVLPPVVRLVEGVCSPFFSAFVAVTPQIQQRFPRRKTILVRNWPIAREFREPSCRPMRDRPREVTYIGTINLNRNILGMLDVAGLVKSDGIHLRLAGDFPVAAHEDAARTHPEWEAVRYDGWVSREGVAEILASARAGLVVLKPVEHETLTFPIKLFEYMAAGVPVISSDFPLWRKFVEEANCGLLVDPMNPSEIADAIRWIVDNPEVATKMGARGREAILTRYSWEAEAKALIELYEKLGVSATQPDTLKT